MAKVYRRRRFAAVLVLIAAVAISVLVIGQALSLTGSGSAVPSTPVAAAAATGPVIVVQQGDTLSSIARRLQPSGSITSLVDRLAAAHGPGPLLAGDRLRLLR